MQRFMLSILIVTLSMAAQAKDKTYLTGTKVEVAGVLHQAGITCDGTVYHTECTEGVNHAWADVHLQLADGTSTSFLHKALGRSDTWKEFHNGDPVQYRIERRGGVNYVVIRSKVTAKEGWYYEDTPSHNLHPTE